MKTQPNLSEADTNNKMTPFTLASYGAPAVPLAMLLLPIYVYLAPFYAKEVGISLSAVGGIFLLARLWDGVSDPLIGYFSDRISTRFGRRKPWVLLGTPALMTTTYFLCMPPSGVGAAYLVVWSMLFYMAWTVLFIPYYSWGAELSPDYLERNRITAYREVGTMLGMLCATGLPTLILSNAPSLRDVLTVFTVSVLILLPLCVGLALWWVPQEPLVNRRETVSRLDIAEICRNKPFVRFLAAMVLILLGAAAWDATIVFMLVERLKLPDSYLSLIFVRYCIAIATAPIFVKYARKYGKHRLLSVHPIFEILSLIVLFLVPPGAYSIALLSFVVGGLATSILRVYPTSLLADVVDYDTLKGGHRRAGVYVAVYNLAYKICMAVGVGVTLPLLDLVGFDPTGGNAQVQLDWLALVTCGIPILLIVPVAFIMWRYPIDRRRHAIITRRLSRREMAAVPRA